MSISITPNEGEKVFYTIRKSLLTRLKTIFLMIGFVVLAIALTLANNLIADYISFALLALIVILGLYRFYIWYFDVYILTNQRIIVINQKNLFSRAYAEVDLAQVHDVTYIVDGFIPTVFHLGHINVKTPLGELELSDVSCPDQLQEVIRKLVDKSR